MFSYEGFNSIPGIQTALETVENTFYWDRFEHQIWSQGILDGAARDSGNTVTDVLRPGLLLGKITATGKLKQFDPTATDGSERLHGILAWAQKMQQASANKDRLTWIMIGGMVKPDKLLLGGQASFGIAGLTYEHYIRRQMFPRFWADDQHQGNPFGAWYRVSAKTADYTVTEADNNTLFTNRGAAGAVIFTLPVTAKLGLRYGFYVAADQSVTVTAGTADTIVAFNDIAADSVAFSTASEKVGGMYEVIGDGTGWLTISHPWVQGAAGQTQTVAT